MEKINKPEGLPECKIINTLIAKANARTDCDFNYVNQLEEFRKIVSIEVSRINQLFPEYTPHDEQYHLKRLFYIADQMLDDEIIENMNATELLLLSVSLYGHDWGMAMSEEEKINILTDCKAYNSTVNLLDDEKSRIMDFCKYRNIDLDKIELEDWREYVRKTHALRSGKRIRKYFESINSGVADFASRICEGHGLDFNVIDDYTSYPTDASILIETVNVKALAIYVRLIDLLDLGEDRTPYVLWKFVAPGNKYSKMEWAKHRVLQPVTFPKYQLTRSIKVEGSTDDQNVYMSIMDFKRYVDEQFRQCSDILNRSNHNYHQLNISHIDWRIAARGFEPVAIQFDFDRDSMFNILSDEIYQGNPYVFIRELLQNAIDAIEMRIEILENIGMLFKPLIKIDVCENDDHYIVQVTDNGIGMDEYIIRNYLVIAGKSYYRSVDFQKEGLKMDPISRFGIGVLSCFMTADYIEIDTHKDPNTTKNKKYLKISIPSKENYFKIKKNTETLNVGTTFRVFVIKNKLPKNKETGKIINFNITEYLRKTAGFVKYPISITEKDIETLIVNPNDNYTKSSSVSKIDYSFPIEKAFFPQDKEVVEEYFVEKRFYLKTDLNLTDFDGCITFLLPKSESIDIKYESTSPRRKVIILNYNTDIKEYRKIEWYDEDTYYGFSDFPYNENFQIIDRNYSVFMNGILIPEITPPDISLNNEEDIDLSLYYRYGYRYIHENFIKPQLIVNIPKPVGLKIDLARTNIKTSERWDKPIWLAFFEYLKNNLVKNILLQEPKKRLLELSKLKTFYNLTDEIIIEYLLENSKFPLPFISNGGFLIYLEHDLSTHKSLRRLSSELQGVFSEEIDSNYVEYYRSYKIIKLWRGVDAIFKIEKHSIFGTLSNMKELITSFVERNYYIDSIEFITSPLGAKFPLIQEVLKLKPDEIPLKICDLEKIDIDMIDNYTLRKLNDLLKNYISYSFPILINFPSPFETKTFFASRYMNANSKTIKSFVNICISVIRAKEEGFFSKEIIGKLFDMIKGFQLFDIFEYFDINIFNFQINAIMDEALNNNIIKKDSYIKSKMTIDDFIENSIFLDEKGNIKNINKKKYLKGRDEWGEIIL